MSISLKQAIKNAGLTNPALAKLIGCEAVEIWRLAAFPAKNGRKMTSEWAAKIAPHLGMKPHELLFGTDVENHNSEINNLRKENEKLKRIIKELLS